MKINYRREIDGLRAIAVGAVILYHAQITIFGHQPFKGGFIGVDIFFVISGYLITSIILKELITTGTFSFKHFYERRIRRILPALLFVMLASLPFAWIYLLPMGFDDYTKSILYSLGFSSNFYFHYSGQQYGAESGLLKPFLHTWSLSVEEQFYILFPIVLLITFKYFSKYLIHILILGFIISLVIADWGSKNHPSFNFYVLPTRVWELLAGSILAYFEITLGHRSKNKTLNLILPTIGLFLIGHSILFFNDEMFHPSFYTLSPIIGVCLIIWFSSKNELITKILSTKLFVGIGLISYSFYLWHYPIFAFARIKDNTPSEYDKFEWVVLSIILSLISYFFVERPFRNKQNKFNKKIILGSIFLFLLFLIINFENKNKNKNKIHKNFQRFYISKQNNLTCTNRNENFCIWNKGKEKKLFLIGDSLLGSIVPEIKIKFKNYEITEMNAGTCFYNPGFNLINKKNKIINNRCTINFQNEVKKYIEVNKDKEKIIILSGQLKNYIDGKKHLANNKQITYKENLLNELKKLLNNKKNKIIFLGPWPDFLGFKYKKNQDISSNTQVLETKSFLDQNKKVFNLIYELKKFNLIHLSIFKFYEHNGKLSTTDGENLNVVDSHHPTKNISIKIVDHLWNYIKNNL